MELFDLVTLTLCFRRKFLVQESFSQDFGDTDCDFYPWLYYHGTDCGVDRRRRHDGSSRLVGRKLPVDDAEQTACIWRCFL